MVLALMAYPGSFELTFEDVGDEVRVLVLTGEADRFRTEDVSRAVGAAREEGREVIIDLSAVSYLDSSMLAALVAASDQGRRRSRRLVVQCRAPRLRRSLELKGLESILHIVETRDEALQRVRGDGPGPGGD